MQLVNGRLSPTIPVRSGERQRWRIVNAGSARIYRLALADHALTVIGSDGGAWLRDTSVSELIVAPDVQLWELVNLSPMTHPFHLHGFFFQVLSRDGVLIEEPTWEDTIELRGEERIRIAFRPDDRPGMWMFHCHIIEHVHHGMMGMVHVAR